MNKFTERHNHVLKKIKKDMEVVIFKEEKKNKSLQAIKDY